MNHKSPLIKSMTRRYVAVLCILAFLTVANYLSLQFVIVGQESAAATVNVSGRQRMLTQRVAMYVHHLVYSDNITEQRRSRRELLAALALMERSHQTLIHDDAKKGHTGDLSPALRAIYFEPPLDVDKKMDSFLSDANSVAATVKNKTLSRSDPRVRRILTAASGPLLKSIDAVVQQHQIESERNIEQINSAMAAGTALSIIVLVISAAGVFRPLARHMAEEMEKKGSAERRLRTVMDTTADGIITVDETGTIQSFNRAAKEIFGYSDKEIIGRKVDMLMPEPHRSRHDAYLSNYLRTGGADIIGKGREVEAQRKDGTTFPLSIAVAETLIDGGTTFVAGVRDITERVQTEKAVRKSNDQLRLLHSITVIANETSNTKDAVKSCIEKICAYVDWPVGHAYIPDKDSPERLLPTDIWHLDYPRKFEAFRELTEKTKFETGIGLPGRVMASGGAAWIKDLSIDRNFTRKKAALKCGLKSSFGLPVLIGKEVVAVLEFFSDRTVWLDVSLMRDLAQIGTSLGRVFERMLHEEQLKSYHQELERTVAYRTKKLSQEVEKRRLTETAFRESQQRLEAITENLLAGLLVVDINGHIVFSNQEANRILLEKEKSRLTGCDIDDIFLMSMGGEKTCFSEGPIRQVMETGKSFRNDDAVFVMKKGEPLNVTYGCSPLVENGKNIGTIISFRNISALKEAQNEALHASKLASVGQLAAGIAHEINTPTQYIGDNLRFLKESFGDMSAVLGSYQKLIKSTGGINISGGQLKDIREALEKADIEYLSEEIPAAIDQSLGGVAQVSQIVSAMKEFSHPGTKDKKPIDLNQAIKNTLMVCRNEWKHAADLETDFAPDLPLVPCYGNEMNQVFLNLIINAVHAIEDSGDEEKGRIIITTCNDGDWIEIRISDTGNGIPAEIRDNIFDLFFTTKEVGKGTGQGLAICQDVVMKKHDGKIYFNSADGKGTEFVIRLPVNPKKESEAA